MSEIGRRLMRVEGKRVEIEEFEVPEPGPGQVLVRVNRSQVSAGTETKPFQSDLNASNPRSTPGGILKKCVNSQAMYPLSEQHGLKARERRYTAHEEGKHWE